MTKNVGNHRGRDDPQDRATFELDEEQTAVFLEALANPPAPTRPLRDLMARPAPWNEDER